MEIQILGWDTSYNENHNHHLRPSEWGCINATPTPIMKDASFSFLVCTSYGKLAAFPNFSQCFFIFLSFFSSCSIFGLFPLYEHNIARWNMCPILGIHTQTKWVQSHGCNILLQDLPVFRYFHLVLDSREHYPPCLHLYGTCSVLSLSDTVHSCI